MSISINNSWQLGIVVLITVSTRNQCQILHAQSHHLLLQTGDFFNIVLRNTDLLFTCLQSKRNLICHIFLTFLQQFFNKILREVTLPAYSTYKWNGVNQMTKKQRYTSYIYIMIYPNLTSDLLT